MDAPDPDAWLEKRLVAAGERLENAQVMSQAEAGLFGCSDEVRVGRFILGPVLGRGAQGTVYEAHDPDLDRAVALKVLAGRHTWAEEARAMAKLNHPHVVTVYEVGEHEGQAFIAMELVDGSTLGRWTKTQEPREVLRALRDAGRGLSAAHAAGLVHRDFKPSNVLVGSDGRARVSDFGLAHTPSAGASQVAGTPAYMAPEQHRGEEVSAAADQYAFCVALYEALIGERPFDGKTMEALEAQKRVPIAVQSDLWPRRVLDAVQRGLSPKPEDRFASMDELLEALEPKTVSLWQRRVVAAIVGLVIGAAMIGAIMQIFVFNEWMNRAKKNMKSK